MIEDITTNRLFFLSFGHCLGAYSTRVGGGGSPDSTTGESSSGSAETSRVSGGVSIEGYMLIKEGKGEKKKTFEGKGRGVWGRRGERAGAEITRDASAVSLTGKALFF